MIHIMLADGFEEIEALTTVDVLRRANLEVITLSVTERSKVEGAHGITVVTDGLLAQVPIDDSELIVLPGGMPGALNLRQSTLLCNALTERAAKNLPIAAICAAPYILGDLNILQGKHATCYPGFEEKLNGAMVTGRMVERDGNIVTGKGPAAAMEFALTLVDMLIGCDVRSDVARGMLIE